MVGEHHQHGSSGQANYSPQARHPDPLMPTALIPQTRAAYYGAVPAWPATMIAPSGSELTVKGQLNLPVGGQ